MHFLNFFVDTCKKGRKQCWIDLDSPLKWRIYMTLVSFTLFLVPTVIITGCYIIIVVTIWNNAQRYGLKKDRRASSRGLIPRAKIKTIKMTFVIVFGKHPKILNYHNFIN